MKTYWVLRTNDVRAFDPVGSVEAMSTEAATAKAKKLGIITRRGSFLVLTEKEMGQDYKPYWVGDGTVTKENYRGRKPRTGA